MDDFTIPVACTLPTEHMGDRLAAWSEVVARATGRERIEGGVRLELPPETDVAALAQLAADEHECCGFFTFRLAIGPAGVTFEIDAPPEAMPAVEALVGATA
jgi:hypothetical protein